MTENRWRLRIALPFILWLCLCFALPSRAEARWPAQPGKGKSSGKLVVDSTHTDEGYIWASLSKKSKKRFKLRIVKGGTTLTYDLNGNAEYELFPLQLGSGKYVATLYENVSGKKYTQAGKVTLDVKLSREDVPFLYPNQYVNYSILSAAVAKADELCAGKGEQEAYQAVCDFMKSTFVYDFIKAVTVKAGTLPDIDGCYDKRMGICQDLSAIMCCMLRTQGIPARLIIGYADRNYHAWTMTALGGKDQFFDPTAAINAISAKDYSEERFY